MNKKVLTLCAGLLLAGGMMSTVNALPANPTQVETKAVVSNAVTTTATLPTSVSNVGATVLPEFTNNSRLFVVVPSNSNVAVNRFVYVNNGALAASSYNTSKVDEFYWTMSGNDLVNNANHSFTVKSYSKFDVVPVTKEGDKLGCFFVLRAKNNDGSFAGFVKYTNSFDLTAGSNEVNELVDAALFVSVETAYSASAMTGTNLNKELGNGFGLTISSAKSEVTSISGVDQFAWKH